MTLTRIKDAGLTKSQLAVAELVLCGHSNQFIADKLYISVKTVKSHCSDIFKTCGVKSRAGLLAKHLPGKYADDLLAENIQLKEEVRILRGLIFDYQSGLPKGIPRA